MAIAASATTYSVTIKDSQLEWSTTYEGKMEARITLTSITSLLKKGDRINVSYIGGFPNYSPYTIAIIDQSQEANWWYELSDWSDEIELDESGNGSAVVTLTESAMGAGRVTIVFEYNGVFETESDKEFTIRDTELNWLENDNGQKEARFYLSNTSLLKKGDKIKIMYRGGNQKKSPYSVAIIDVSKEADYWYELSDWTDEIELDELGGGSTTVTLTKSAISVGNILAIFIQKAILPKSISFGKDFYEINVGETTVISATFSPDNVTETDLSWTSSDNAIATVSPEGVVSGISEGTVIITATSTAEGCNNVKKRILVTVQSNWDKTWDFQYEGLCYKIQSNGTVWVTHGAVKKDRYYSYTDYDYDGDFEDYFLDHIIKSYYTDIEASTISEQITIPNQVEHNGTIYTVSGIDDYAFVKNGVTGGSIGININYLNVQSIFLPKTVSYIGTCAFNINTLHISDVESFCDVDFENDNYDDDYDYGMGETNYNEIDFNGKPIVELVIPNSVETKLDQRFKTPSLQTLIIGNSIYAISEDAFRGCSKLNSVVIGKKVESIGSGAFSGCSSLSKITCYAVEPPTVSSSTFSNYNGYLTIPCDNFEAYDIHSVWGTFKHVDCLSAESVDIEKDAVVVEPDVAKAAFSMPINEDANSYTLTISNNGEVFCSITFNAQGQLANIDFSTTKSYRLKSDVAAYQFTVTGLSAATDYGYSFKALNKSKAVLKEYTGTFTTKNEDGTGGSVQGGGEGTLAVEAVSNATAVTIVNGQILVNGEAPAFVVTVSGQKIANANLKSGVYFVVVDGNSVSVVVR